MVQKIISCFKCVDGELVKNGKAASGKKRFLCKSCKRTQIIEYTYKALFRPKISLHIYT